MSALTMSVAAAGLFLVALDFSINAALPVMRDSLGASLVSIQGIIIYYHASRSGLAPAAGAIGDSLGLKRVFLAGVVLYTGAVALISLQDSLASVVALRVLQGLGAGMLFTTGPALVAKSVGPTHKGLALGVTLAAVSAGQLTATLGGGWLAQQVGWEAVFYARLPVGIAVLVAGVVVLRDPTRRPGPASTARQMRFDWLAATLLYAGLFLVVMLISYVRLDGLASVSVLAAGAGAIATLALFRLVNGRRGRPVIPRGLWSAPGFRPGAISNVLINAGAFVTWFLFPFYVTDMLGHGAAAAGAMLATVAAATTMGSIVGGWMADRLGDRFVTALGALVTAAGLAWVGMLAENAALSGVAIRVAVAGAGFGVHQAAVYSLMLRSTKVEHAAAGSAVLAVTQTIGMPLAVTIGTAVFSWGEHNMAAHDDTTNGAAFMNGFMWAYLAACVAALLAAASVVRLSRRRAVTVAAA